MKADAKIQYAEDRAHLSDVWRVENAHRRRLEALEDRVRALEGANGYGGVDPVELVRELRKVIGLPSGALPITPKAAWDEAIRRVRLVDWTFS